VLLTCTCMCTWVCCCCVPGCSAGVLRVRSPEWGGAWVPLLDAAAAKAATGSDAPLWPAWLEGGSLMAVVNSTKMPHPQVMTPASTKSSDCAAGVRWLVLALLCCQHSLRVSSYMLAVWHHSLCPHHLPQPVHIQKSTGQHAAY
jgi:hypothetical protein